MIGIRADANEQVATGHIMRCITIAVQLAKLGEEVVFITADDGAEDLLRDTEFEYVNLESDWENPESELDMLKQLIDAMDIKVLLVDSYKVTPAYIEAVSEICKVVYIDDLHEAVYKADMIINYNGYHRLFDYEKEYGTKTKLLLGPGYVPLRPQFYDAITIEKTGKDINVLLACGGGDAYDVMLGVLQEYDKQTAVKNIKWQVVVGGFMVHREELLDYAEGREDIVLHRGVQDMAGLMRQCDIAVSAAGTMMYELCACQIPTVFLVTADNQRYDADYFLTDKIAVYAGDIRDERDTTLKNIINRVSELLAEDSREDLIKAMADTTDGHGAEKIAKEIADL